MSRQVPGTSDRDRDPNPMPNPQPDPALVPCDRDNNHMAQAAIAEKAKRDVLEADLGKANLLLRVRSLTLALHLTDPPP